MSAKLVTRMVAKPWGRTILPPPFKAPLGQKIGEVWFEPKAYLASLLIKYIFTSERLSVQVHPSDTQTSEAGLGLQGKEECWLVIAAEKGAALGIGFGQSLSPEELRRAASDGSIESRMEWHPVRAGDFFYIPAGTVHAIGAGVSLIEVQQNSDITYRLYDYNRPRELHLDEAIAVAKPEAYNWRLYRPTSETGQITLVEGPHFRLDQVVGQPSNEVQGRYTGPLLVMPLSGFAMVEGETISAGECGVATALDAVEFSGRCLIAQPV